MASNQDHRIEHGDDDFEDFGGFETADPVPNMAASQAQAAASPWALFNAGNMPGRPDLLCAQNQFPNYLDPSGIAGPANGSDGDMATNANHSGGNIGDGPPADLLGAQIMGNQARIAENVLDGTLNAGAVSGFHLMNGRLPDLGLGMNEDRLFNQAGPVDASIRNHADYQQVAAPLATPPLEIPNSHQNNSNANNLERASVVQPVADEISGAGACANIVPLGQATQASPQETEPLAPPDINSGRYEALQQRLNTVTEENQQLTAELERSQGELEAQRLKLQEVEERHEATLSEVRQAGHDALAVVVEQYKEQMKVVILEQQEEARRQITEAIREQMRVFQEMLHTQRDHQDQQREEHKEEVSQHIAQACEQSRQQQQEQFQAFLTDEQEKQREVIKKALEDERQVSQVKMQEQVAAEVDRNRTKLEEAQTEAAKKLDEERKSHESALESLREEEKRLAREEMSNLACEERERGRELTREAVAACRQESQSYLQEQRQADSRVRQRHLASLDLFMESCCQQIALLMASETNQATSQPSPPRGASSENQAASSKNNHSDDHSSSQKDSEDSR